ncbi:putative late blight resistance protein homolog R1B-16 [Salvia splendens]|uniref:putative late blight resistance protein homolog R1B-16 n=1 Tax=Salvia splendens TaxID=180675 RepID=UPI001C274763|nr:putative late blight resistance protein homolog R1B-16 [Salvia splendens]
MAYEAVDSLQQTLLLILQRHDHLITPPVKQQLISIHDKAVVLQFNLKHFPDKETIREVANTAEKIIQYLFSSQNLSDCGFIHPTVRLSDQLGKLAKELESTVGYVVDYCKSNGASDSPAVSSSSRYALKSEVQDLKVAPELIVRLSIRLRRLTEKIKSTARASVDENPSDSPSIPPFTYNDVVLKPTSKDLVVGFDEDVVPMRNRIIGYDALTILPVVGMAGIGKSEYAKYIYHDPFISCHFDIRAWVKISLDYSIASVLSQLLASLKGKVDRLGRDSLKVIEAEELEIYKILSGRRYLIVMDDIWSAEVCDDVRKLFPDNHNGSRIILTTRLMDVAIYAATGWKILMMRFLDDKQSWRLFHHKVFGDQDCPLELQSVGEKIVKGCGGLPLSIVTVARLLSGIPRTPKMWLQIERNDGQLESVLSLSYNHLPPHLRECFLYMAGFPQDYEIYAYELIKLWVAEGFLEGHNDTTSIEVVAEKCLEDLIKQSLVLVTSRKSNGRTKTCRLHSMVRDFCVRKAGQEKFLLSVTDYFPNPILRRHFLPQVLQNHHRVSVSWHDLLLKDSTHSSCTTSIMCIPQRGYRPKCSVENFTSLRVLHVLRENDHSYWELGHVFELIHLTYLASYIPDSIVPPAIAKLQNLQTLIIYRSEVRLPVEIWSLRQLRHLIAFSFCSLPLPEGVTLSLENLQTLSMATNFVCSGRMVRMIPNIKKLEICYSQENFGVGNYLDNLIQLHKLEKLKLEMHSSSVTGLNTICHPFLKLKVRSSFVSYLDNLVFPPSLIKLELSGGWISWKDMTIIGSLPNLQVLKLKNYACHGEYWETIKGEFCHLMVLLVEESNLQRWTTECSHFPRLRCLMLHRCPYLNEIPSDIGDIPTLKLIEIDDHNQSLLCSAKIIQEDQHKYFRNYRLKVVVKHS